MHDTFASRARSALAGAPVPIERLDIEVERLVSIMETTAVEGRAAGLPQDEIDMQVRAWGDLHVRLLKTAAAASPV